MPQSPPPSNSGDHLQHNLRQLLQYNKNMDYPPEYFQHDEGVHLQSSHDSPPPLREDSNAYRGQRGRYTYQHQHHDSGIGVQSDDYSQDYRGMSDQDRYSTPAMSPPSMNTTEFLRTRSGMGVQKGQQNLRPKPETRPRIEKSPKPRRVRKEKSKAEKKVARLEEPLSKLTKDWKNAEVVDIAAYVNRSAEERQREVAQGKVPGKVKRPMNSFMLYRKAYQNRTKDWCLQNNHQVVSQVCGDSWPLEPDEVREQFNEWARIERVNHQNAHPGYKFSPTKPGTAKSTKRKPSEEPTISEVSDGEDSDWRAGPSRRAKKTKQVAARDVPVAYPTTRSAYQYSSRESSVDPNYGAFNQSSFQITNPGKQPPSQFQAHLPPGQYWQTIRRSHPTIPGAEDIIHTTTASPGINMHSYLGLPGGHEFGVMNMYTEYDTQPTIAPEPKIDPSLLSHSHGLYGDGEYGKRASEGIYLGDTQYSQKYPVAYDGVDPYLSDPILSYVEPEHNQEGMPLHDPHLDILGGRHEGWSTLEDVSEFDKWNHPEQ